MNAPYMHRTTISNENVYCHHSFQNLLLGSVYGACMVHFNDFVRCKLFAVDDHDTYNSNDR